MKSRPFWHSLRPTICIGVAATPTFSRRQPSCVPLFRSTLRQGISIGWGRSFTSFACVCISMSPIIRGPISTRPSTESMFSRCLSNSVMRSVCSKCHVLCLPWCRWVRGGRLVALRHLRCLLSVCTWQMHTRRWKPRLVRDDTKENPPLNGKGIGDGVALDLTLSLSCCFQLPFKEA